MDAKQKNSPARTVAASLCMAMLIGTSASAGSIQIRKQAATQNRDVYLRDVAVLSSDLVASFNELVVGHFDVNQTKLDVTGAQIRKALTRRGQNTVVLNFSGFEVCRVTFQRKNSEKDPQTTGDRSASKPIRSVDAAAAPVLSNPAEEVGLDARMTVRQRIVDWLVKKMNVSRNDLLVEFDERHQAVLDAPAWRDSFAFTTSSSGFLGRLPLVITRIRDEKLVDTQRVTIAVARRKLTAVATRDLKRGDVIRSGDLEIREVKLTRDQGASVGKIADAIGQVVKGTVRAGHVVSLDDIEPPVFVRRNEIVQVKVVSGGLLVQTFGRAMDDGALGEFVRVRNESSKETFIARVIGKRLATLEVKAPRSGRSKP